MAEHFASVTNINQWIHHFYVDIEKIQQQQRKLSALIFGVFIRWFDITSSCCCVHFKRTTCWLFMTLVRNKNRKRSQMNENNAISLFSNVSRFFFLSFFILVIRTSKLSLLNCLLLLQFLPLNRTKKTSRIE